MRLKNKVAIITGAASGMGAATAKIFADEGAKIVLTDLLTEEGKAVAEAIRIAGSTAQFMPHDVSDETAWARVIEQILKTYGQIDVLVNNAGVSGSDPDQLRHRRVGSANECQCQRCISGNACCITTDERGGSRVGNQYFLHFWFGGARFCPYGV